MADQTDQLTDIQASAGTNLSLLVGQLQGGFREVKQLLLDQNQQHVRDKEEAIKERDRRHEENKTAILAVSVAVDGTAAVTAKNALWIEQKGERLIGRVSDLEQINNAEAAAKAQAEEGQKIVAAEKRGWWKAWGKIIALGSAIGGLIVLLLENLDAVVDIAKRLFAHEGGEMTAGKAKVAGGAGAVVGIGILVSILWGFEGNRPVTYLDPVGIPTVCVGHTGSDVRLGDRKTDDECRALLTGDALEAWDAVERDVIPPMQPYQQAALASFVFNVGDPAFRGSTMLRLANLALWDAACRELPRWVYAGPPQNRVVLPGLVKRRAAEMKLCLGGGV